MFIHWGVYSVLGDGEWIMETRPINRTDYTKVPAFFNPIKFDRRRGYRWQKPRE